MGKQGALGYNDAGVAVCHETVRSLYLEAIWRDFWLDEEDASIIDQPMDGKALGLVLLGKFHDRSTQAHDRDNVLAMHY